MTITTKNAAVTYIDEVIEKIDFLSQLVTGNDHLNGKDQTEAAKTNMELVYNRLVKEKDKMIAVSGMEILIDDMIAKERAKHEKQSAV